MERKTANGHDKYERLVARAKTLQPIRTAVAHPCDGSSLGGAVEAAKIGLIVPILVGPVGRIKDVARQEGIDISAFSMVDAPHSHAAAEKAVELVRTGKADALMKGSLHTDELMAAVVAREAGSARRGGSVIASSWTCPATPIRSSSPTRR